MSRRCGGLYLVEIKSIQLVWFVLCLELEGCNEFPKFKSGLIVKYLVVLGQSLGWDRRARIQLGRVHLGVDTFWENLYFWKYT